jgi:ribosomal subunit interface protein
MLHIEISYSGMDRSDALDEHVREQVGHELRRFSDRLTRVEVHLSDNNAAKRGSNDRRCVLEARPRSMEPIVTKEEGDEIFLVVRNAARKLERALAHKFEKADAVQ